MNAHRIRRQVVEELYEEALLLADETRAAFDLRDAAGAFAPSSGENADGDAQARVAQSVEGLRTTTRLMNLLAWLLNQRAYIAGELSEGQMRRSGGLAADRPADAAQLAQLDLKTRALVRESERLYARAERLDRQERAAAASGPVQQLQDRIVTVFAPR